MQPRARIAVWLRWLLPLVLAVLLFVSLRSEFPEVGETLRNAQPVALLCVPLFLIWNHAAALAWARLLHAAGVSGIGLARLARLRIEAQAVNQVVPSAGLAGEVFRTTFAAGPSQLGSASVATALDNVAGTIAGLVFAITAVALHLFERSGPSELGPLALYGMVALILVLVLAALPFVFASRWLVLLTAKSSLRDTVEIFSSHAATLRRALRDAVALRFLERALGVVEIWILFRATGATLSVTEAALISAVIVLVSIAAFFVPGQLGVAEAAVSSAAVLLGFPAALGLSAALLRRARQLLVCAAGIISLLLRGHGFRPVRQPSAYEELG